MKEYVNQKPYKQQLHMICMCCNDVRHPVTKTCTTLHYTSRHFTSSHLNFTQLHFTTLSFGLTPFKFPTAPFHLTSLHFTSLHFSARLDDFHLTSVLFISPRFLTLFLEVFGLQGKVPNASAGSWFQFLMVLCTKAHFPISFQYTHNISHICGL